MSRLAAVTAAGVAFCLVAAAVPVLAFYVPGLALLLVAGISRGSAVVWARRARVFVRVARRTVVGGEQVVVQVDVSRTGWLSGPLSLSGPPSPSEPLSHSGSLSLSGPPSANAGAEPPLPFPPGERELRVSFTAQGRGVQPLGPVSVTFADPFGLCRKRVLAPAGELLVLPRVEELDGECLSLFSPPGAGGDAASDMLRRYRPGTAVSRIHWPAVARSGELHERAQGAAGRVEGPVIVLDGTAPVPGQAFERAVAAAASLCAAFAQQGGCRLLLPGESVPVTCTAAAWPRLHERLAIVQPGAAPRAALPGQCVVYVTGCPERIAATPGVAASFVVDASGCDGRPGLFSLCGCPVRAPARLQAA